MSSSSRHNGRLGEVCESRIGKCNAYVSQTDRDITHHHEPRHYARPCSRKRHLHPGLKLIRILSEENLKERVTHSQISPSFDVRRIISSFTRYTTLWRQRGWYEGGPVFTCHPQHPSHHQSIFYLNVISSLFSCLQHLHPAIKNVLLYFPRLYAMFLLQVALGFLGDVD